MTEDEAVPGARRGGWRRKARSRLSAALAAAVVGVLLGAGGTAWRTGALPLSEDRACWGALTEADTADLLGGGKVTADETLFQDSGRPAGQCRLTRIRGSRGATVRVHTPGGPLSRDANNWDALFLTSDMVALGGDRTGMASDGRAWLALPTGCAGGSTDQAPTIVDVDMSYAESESRGEDERMAARRTALARTVVTVANALLERLDCEGVFKVPGKLSAVGRWREAAPNGLCGVEGLAVPPAEGRKKPPQWMERRSAGGGPVRVCAAGTMEADTSLVTVEHQGIAEVLTPLVRRSGVPVESAHGAGTLGSDRAAFRLTCQTGDVVFLVRRDTWDADVRDTRTMLTRYVAQEAERLGCGRVEIRRSGKA